LNSVNSFGSAIEAVGLAGLVAFSYASTNLDNFLVLSAYSAKPGYQPFFGRLAFVSVCLTVIVASLAIARVADALVADKLRYLSVISLGLGLYELGKLVFNRSQPDGEKGEDKGPALVAWSFYLGFALALLANSSDSVIVLTPIFLTPIFADLKLAFIVICAIAAVVVALTLSSVASFIGTHPLLRAQVEKVGAWALPFLLIGIGLMILLSRPDDAFVAGAALSEQSDSIPTGVGRPSNRAPQFHPSRQLACRLLRTPINSIVGA
jgi:cadmium resistance protein CadD (predicted permease)